MEIKFYFLFIGSKREYMELFTKDTTMDRHGKEMGNENEIEI
jgi:hypothetical protein